MALIDQTGSLGGGAGCGGKLAAETLARLLAPLEYPTRPEVLAGLQGNEDAGVIQLTPELAIVQTTDFFTQVDEDPRTFGRIAATNALSDIWAMGAEPISALNLLTADPATHGEAVIGEVLRGGLEVLAEHGVALLGGHTLKDPVLRYGLAATGTVHPAQLLRNATGQAGDVLVLSKPVGVGAILTAGAHASAAAREAARAAMLTANAAAARAARAARASALTDVTGFGLLGHLHELAHASGLQARISAAAVPTLPHAAELIAEHLCGGSRRNRSHAETFTTWDPSIPEPTRRLLTDAVTSGGLLAALPAARAGAFPGAVIGELTVGTPGRIKVGC